MEPLDPVLVELEPSVRVNLREYLRRDLEREYQPKHRTKANKLGPQAVDALDLSGEHLLVMVRDQGKIQKVDMTFPLFDLDSDFTLIQCSCMREALSLDPLRCHHMYLAQTVVAHRLDHILKQEKPDNALAQLQSYLQAGSDSPAAEEELLLEQRWLLLWDSSTGGLSAERYTKPRYEKEASWRKEGRWTSSELLNALAEFKDVIAQSLRTALLQGANRPDDELFEVLRLVEGHNSIVLENRDTRDPIEVRPGTWQLGIREEDEGYRLHIEVGPGRLPPWKIVPGRGLIAFDEAAQIIFLCPLDKRSEGLISGVQQQKRPIPLQDRDAMLDFIEKLDPGIAVLWSDRPLERVAVYHPQPMLRLSPFQRGGMKVEIWIQLSPGTAVRAGEGPEELRERSRRGSLRQFIRDFAGERQLARRVENLLDLNILPEPENSIFIAYNDEVALALMARIEEHKKDLDLIIEWPAALAGKDKPYAVSALVKDQPLRVSAGEKRDWFSVDGWLEMDDGQKIALRELLAACRQQKKYLRLSDGKWAAITEQFRQKMEPLVQSIDEDDEGCSLNLAALESDEQLQAIEKLDFTEASQGFLETRAEGQTQSSGRCLPAGEFESGPEALSKGWFPLDEPSGCGWIGCLPCR